MPWNLLPFLLCVFAAPIAPKGLGPQTWLGQFVDQKNHRHGIWHMRHICVWFFMEFPIIHASQGHFWSSVICHYYGSYWFFLDAESTLHNCCLQSVRSPLVLNSVMYNRPTFSIYCAWWPSWCIKNYIDKTFLMLCIDFVIWLQFPLWAINCIVHLLQDGNDIKAKYCNLSPELNW